MPRGFFSASSMIQKAPAATVPLCGACGLYKTCRTPKIGPSGKGRRRILLISESPGEQEDKHGKLWAGQSGRYLESVLRKLGVDAKSDCWLHHAIICQPKGTIPANVVDYCRPNMTKALRELDPEIVIPLGGKAVESLISHVWKEDVGSVTKWAGWNIPYQEGNFWICPTYSPAFILHSKNAVLERRFVRHLKAAVKHSGRPYQNGAPNFRQEVQVIKDPDKAAKIIRKEIAKTHELAAFDYECNMLKPDWPEARIVCCSICWDGARTISYPMIGEAVSATQEFLQSDVQKIAQNLKFEDRWSNAVLRTKVRNWKWDTMNVAHIQDCRDEITSIKFQGFASLGESSYNDHIAQFLRPAKKGGRINRIQDISLDDLLLYCGLDSLIEYRIAVKQMRKFQKGNQK